MSLAEVVAPRRLGNTTLLVVGITSAQNTRRMGFTEQENNLIPGFGAGQRPSDRNDFFLPNIPPAGRWSSNTSYPVLWPNKGGVSSLPNIPPDTNQPTHRPYRCAASAGATVIMQERNVTSDQAVIHDGQQGKHVPGHNNFQPGKSELTYPNPKSYLTKVSGEDSRLVMCQLVKLAKKNVLTSVKPLAIPLVLKQMSLQIFTLTR
jgi:hypothetical protein